MAGVNSDWLGNQFGEVLKLLGTVTVPAVIAVEAEEIVEFLLQGGEQVEVVLLALVAAVGECAVVCGCGIDEPVRTGDVASLPDRMEAEESVPAIVCVWAARWHVSGTDLPVASLHQTS